ncbi:tyrosine-type recombinase/integrase [Heyndrickxia coagulans]|uniref:Tyrosine-type recombinase/integrase n=1 Tax=Heyndrickxia coagulans TaxID=1398 RepID=A0AAW7C7Q5_HEYCO|nr:tyrosine-type recombinase/integrase [Heyndrickxia coagulans]MDL5039665.1 tyrosine-type recombinase/integrase [Heyndrickxia coagulans]
MTDIDFQRCQIRVNQGKGKKDRIVPFLTTFKELLAMHADSAKKKGAVYLFESLWKKKYTDRGIRKILKKYSDQAGMVQSISPYKLRHFLLTWLKKNKALTMHSFSLIVDMQSASHLKCILSWPLPVLRMNMSVLSLSFPYKHE